jgi:hypothetical protein
MNEYLLNINSKGATAVLKLTYKNNKFLKLEFVSGKLSQVQHESLMKLVPQLEPVILILKEEFKGRVEWVYIQKKESKSLFSAMAQLYLSWYQDRFKIKAKFTGIEGNALKQIIKHLEELSFGDESQILAIWENILQRWNEQTTFYRGQSELRQINSNLNIILRVIKYGKSATEKGETPNRGADSRKI